MIHFPVFVYWLLFTYLFFFFITGLVYPPCPLLCASFSVLPSWRSQISKQIKWVSQGMRGDYSLASCQEWTLTHAQDNNNTNQPISNHCQPSSLSISYMLFHYMTLLFFEMSLSFHTHDWEFHGTTQGQGQVTNTVLTPLLDYNWDR